MIAGLDAEGGERFDAFLDEGGFAEAVEHDRAAVAGEALGDGEADAVEGAGNEGGFTFQHCRLSCGAWPALYMSFDQTQAFIVFAVVAAITPGPSNVMLTATGASVGVLRGLPCLVGVGAGMGLMMALVAFGLGSLVLGSPLVAEALRWCGVAFLLWLAWRIATASESGSSYGGRPVGFVGAALFQWLNPKAWLVTTSAAGTYLQPDAGSAFVQSAALGALFLAAAVPSGFVWLAAGVGLQRVLGSPRRRRIFNIAMGAMLAASVVWFIW